MCVSVYPVVFSYSSYENQYGHLSHAEQSLANSGVTIFRSTAERKTSFIVGN